ncbi:unnamed protein product, partial [Sphagnum tenellum]
DCPKSKSGVGSSKVLALNATLAQKECNRLIFLKGKIAKRDVLCLLDTGASHNFITRENAESMELHLEELKAPIEYEPEEVTKSVTSAKCIRRVLEEFPNVMPAELPEDLPPRRRVDHAIEVMPG